MNYNDHLQQQQPTLIEAYDDEIEEKSLLSVPCDSDSDSDSVSDSVSDSDSDSVLSDDEISQGQGQGTLEGQGNYGSGKINLPESGNEAKQDRITSNPFPLRSKVDFDNKSNERCRYWDAEEKQSNSQQHSSGLSVSCISRSTGSLSYLKLRPNQENFETDHANTLPQCNQEKKRNMRVVDHTYRDLSRIPADIKYTDLLENPQGQFSFPLKLHAILKKYAKYIGWLPHGRAFRVIVPKRFETHVLPEFSRVQNRRHTFIKHIINWGFKHIIKGPDRNSYYHEAFLQDLPHLVVYMTFKIRTKPFPDPDNEPCFYKIHRMSPLPRFANQETSFEEDVTESTKALSSSTHASSTQSLAQPALSYARMNIEHHLKLPPAHLNSNLEVAMMSSSDCIIQKPRSQNDLLESTKLLSSSTHATPTQSLIQPAFSYARRNIEHHLNLPSEHLNPNLEVAMMNPGGFTFNTRYAAAAATHPSSNYNCGNSLDAMTRFSEEADRMNEEELKQSLLINHIQQQQILQSSCNIFQNFLPQGPKHL